MSDAEDDAWGTGPGPWREKRMSDTTDDLQGTADYPEGYPPRGMHATPKVEHLYQQLQRLQQQIADLQEVTPINMAAESARQRAIRRTIADHERKLERARQLLEALERIPVADPYQDGQVLRCSRSHADRQVYTYALIRAGGLWYGTGKHGPYRAGWAQLVDWLVDGRVGWLDELGVVGRLDLGGGTGFMSNVPPELVHGVDPRANMSIDEDKLAEAHARAVTPLGEAVRRHLLSRHHNLAALGLTDAEAVDQHHHEHYSSGTIRNHPFADLSYGVAGRPSPLLCDDVRPGDYHPEHIWHDADGDERWCGGTEPPF